MEKQKETFRKLKKRFTKELVLAVLDLDKKMRMEVDVSNYTIGTVIVHLDTNIFSFSFMYFS